MINDVEVCWICKLKIGKSGSRHHLFNFYDFKTKMVQTFEDISKDKIRFAWLKTKDKIPSYKVHSKCHRELEKRLRNEYNFKPMALDLGEVDAFFNKENGGENE